MNPILIQLGPLQVHWYGFLIVTGAVLAAWLATQEASTAAKTRNTSGACSFGC